MKLFGEFVPHKTARRPWRRHRATAFGLLLLLGIALVFLAPPVTSFVRRSVSVQPPRAEERTIEARLSGTISWAPFRGRSAVGTTKSTFRVTSELAAMGGNESPSTPRELAIAQLLTGHPRQALSRLKPAAESTNDARALNDLAVALFETAAHHEAPELLADSLAACDRAITADPGRIEPLFNRALALEHLGLREDARVAWDRYLARDGSSEWATEARERLRALVPAKPFLDLADEAAARGAFSEIRGHVRANPEGARARTEMQILGRWGKAVLSKHPHVVKRNLRIARDVGAELAALNGDAMVMLAVSAIDRAGLDPQTLASAHADYEDGLALFQANRPGDAEVLLRRAASSFTTAGSAMSRRARYYAANTAFEQGRRNEALREVQDLLDTAPDRLHAERAELLWQLGSSAAMRAEWGEAIRNLDAAAATFEQLGEVRNAAAVRRMLAVVFDRIGDPDRAWSHRMTALRGVGDRSDQVLVKAVASIAGAASLGHKWHTALSFLTIEIEVAQRTANDVQLADALLARAATHRHLGNVVRAREDLASAARATSRVNDASYAAYGHAAHAMVRATLTSSPSERVLLLSDAIAFQSAKGDRMNLPGLFLQRARAHRENGDVTQADADLESGIVELESHRESLPRGDARWGTFFGADELFEETIDLAIDRKDVPRAFAAAERGRARVMLEAYGHSPLDDSLPPPGTVVVEYAALPARLVAFVASASGISLVATKCDRDVVAAEAAAFASALASDDVAAVRRTGSVLYRRLVEPVAAQLTNVSTVVFVPDPVTATVPFNALIDREGRYLVEQHAVVVAPSAAAFSAAMEKRGAAKLPTSVAIVANAEAEREAKLGLVSAEARGVARAYPSATPFEGENATPESLARSLSTADVVHFAGHAVGDESGLLPASLVLRHEGRELRVTAAEIARFRVRAAPTVVLAGCSTARGEKRGVEGVMSVAHGFLVAGAPSVVATLWPIDDGAAAAFFPRLHERLADGLPPAEALRAVQIDAIRNRDVPPSLWAALVAIGS